MAEVIEIFRQKKTFTLEEAKNVLPVIRRLTETAYDEVEKMLFRLDYLTDPAARKELEDLIQKRFEDWYFQVKKFGVEAKGLWLVDFDSGNGYYCWKFPESEVTHFHGYDEGFKNRVEIQ